MAPLVQKYCVETAAIGSTRVDKSNRNGVQTPMEGSTLITPGRSIDDGWHREQVRGGRKHRAYRRYCEGGFLRFAR